MVLAQPDASFPFARHPRIVQKTIKLLGTETTSIRFRRQDSRLIAIWTFHKHSSLFRDQDRAPFGGQLGASTPT
jgi:hypothetical protein